MRTALLSFVAAASLSSVAGASMVQIASNQPGSTDMLGKFVGSISYTANTLNTGTLTFVITNTNTAAEGGYITGLVFNIPGSDASATSLLTSATFAGFADTGSVASASPYGTYEAGAALGASWLGGGSPTGGIGHGATGTLVFHITTAGANALTASDFLAGGVSPSPLLRFRGFTNGGSDKVPGTLVPASGTAAMLGAAGLVAIRRRRR